MRKKSMANAFIMLSRKPWLLLLLLPMQALQPLLYKVIMPKEANPLALSTSAGILSFFVTLFVGLGVMLLLMLLSNFLLVPPAMELLRDGAENAPTEPGWYRRGLKRHWWKPFTLDVIKEAILMALVFGFYIILFLVMIAMIPLALASVSPSSTASPTEGFMIVIFIILLLVVLLLVLIMLVIDAYCTMLLPALADRSFGRAFKAVFTARGFLKVLKMIGVELIIGVVSLLIVVAFAAVYILLSGIPSSMEAASNAILRFEGSWTFFFVVLLTSALALYKYTYSFCLFQEIRDAENASAAAGQVKPALQEHMDPPAAPEPPENVAAEAAQSADEEKMP